MMPADRLIFQSCISPTIPIKDRTFSKSARWFSRIFVFCPSPIRLSAVCPSLSFPSIAFQCWPLSILCISAPRRASACPSPRICRVLFLPCCLSLVTSCCHSLSRSRSEALRPEGFLTVKKKLLGQRKLLTAEKEPAGQKATYECKQCRNGLRKIRFANRTTLPLELYV